MNRENFIENFTPYRIFRNCFAAKCNFGRNGRRFRHDRHGDDWVNRATSGHETRAKLFRSVSLKLSRVANFNLVVNNYLRLKLL